MCVYVCVYVSMYVCLCRCVFVRVLFLALGAAPRMGNTSKFARALTCAHYTDRSVMSCATCLRVKGTKLVLCLQVHTEWSEALQHAPTR